MTGQNTTRYVRYESGRRTSFGTLDGDTVEKLGVVRNTMVPRKGVTTESAHL